MARRILAAVALCLCTVHSVEEESLQGLSSWDQSASSILQILRPAKHDPVTSKEGTVSVELELRGAEGTLLAVEINGGEWSLWTADASCGSPDHLCTVHVHHVRPGPIRLNVALLDVRGVHVAEASVFFFCDGEFYRGDLLARNPWIEDHTWQRRRPAVASVNLAHRGEAHQQSTAFSAHANLAVDGRTESDFSQGSCSHTNVPSPGGFGDGPADPWWTVALRGGMGSVRSVTIHNRRDCQECSESLRGFHVLLSNESLTAPLHGLVEDGDGSAGALEGRLSYLLELRGGEGVVECGETWLLSEEDLTGPVTLECRGVASHVTIWLPGFQRTLTLCEVQVWGERLDVTKGSAEKPRGAENDEASPGRDAVIGLADKYRLTKLLPFLISLRRSGFRGGIFLFLSDLRSLCGDDTFARKGHIRMECGQVRVVMEALGVTLPEWPIDVRTPDRLVPFDTDMVRLELFGRFASEARAKGIQRIFALDTRDVFFQADPFASLPATLGALGARSAPGRAREPELHLFQESSSMLNSSINREWVASCWGLEALREMDERGLVDGSEMRVICSGSVAGSPEGIAGYAGVLLGLLAEGLEREGTRCHVGDQGALNLAVRRAKVDPTSGLPMLEGRISFKEWENGALVLTLGGVSRDVPVLPGKGQVMLGCTSRDGCGVVWLSDNPNPPAVIHQYPGIEWLILATSLFLRTYVFLQGPEGEELGFRDTGGAARGHDPRAADRRRGEGGVAGKWSGSPGARGGAAGGNRQRGEVPEKLVLPPAELLLEEMFAPNLRLENATDIIAMVRKSFGLVSGAGTEYGEL